MTVTQSDFLTGHELLALHAEATLIEARFSLIATASTPGSVLAVAAAGLPDG